MRIRPYVPLLMLFLSFGLAAPVAMAIASNYQHSLADVLVFEGGNDDDPRDPGGRTSRGILQREWNVWRRTHPGLPADVWQAPQSEIVAIYRVSYWDHPCVRGDALPAGLDLTTFDYGVNSGVGRAGKVLRRVLSLPDDSCTITDEVLSAVRRANPTRLIHQVNDERLAFLKRLPTWEYFGKGWGHRVAFVLADSLKLDGASTAIAAMHGKRMAKLALGPDVFHIPLRPSRGPGKAFEVAP